VTFDVLSANPEATARAYDVAATPRADLRAVRAAISRSDAVLSGGGGLFQNATSTRSLLYYTGILRSAIRAEKRSMIFAQSIGPLDFIGRAIVRVACRGLGAATVRDERSRVLLHELLPNASVTLCGDPVFLYDPPATGADLAVEGLDAEGGPLVVVAVRKSANFAGVTSAVARAVDRLAERYGARVAFLPLGGAEDADASSRIIRSAKSSPALLPEHDLDGVAAIIARAHAVIGMRLHALILAARLGVPFLAIPYDPKVSALCADLAYPLQPLIDPGAEPPPAGRIESLVDQLWSSHEALASHLRDATASMRVRAERNFDVLDALLQGATVL
jgi:polysaccharide pyruvyl transferase CsaB